MSKAKIGITIGDINGVGPQVIIKALSNEMLLNECTPVIYGSSKALGYHKNIVGEQGFHFVSSDGENITSNKINVVNCWTDGVSIDLGKATVEGGKCAYIALDRAVNDLKAGYIDALVTAPINKHAMKLAQFPFLGHTEYIADQCEASGDELMLMVSKEMRVAVISTHIPVSEVASHVTQERVKRCILSLEESLKKDFGIERPTIAVLGLNPHAGDTGEIGHEDEEIIKPIIIELKKQGKIISGPFPADGFFGGTHFKKYDAILAMYHDQGLIPFKAFSFGNGVNFTAGLDVVRTSPDHGTGYDIVDRNLADPSSMRQAIFNAIDIFRSRKEYEEINRDRIKKNEIRSEGAIA